jgi:16S rRNA G1207 methylase RsmC
MRLPENGTLLDLGCGYGVIGLVAASLKPELYVTMTDVNKRATAIAKENVERMQLSNVRVINGNLYDPIKNEKFDAIISNPPISAGMEIVKLMVYGAVDHLNSGGTIQLVIKWNKGGRILSNFLEDIFGGFEILKRRSGYRIFLSSYEP